MLADDAVFIAAARTAVPALSADVMTLVARVRKLEAEQDDVARRLIIMETTPHD